MAFLEKVALIATFLHVTLGCQFYPTGDYLRFVRVPENLSVGGEVLRVEVHPRRNLILQAIDKNDDSKYFTYKDVNRTTVALLLSKSLEDLVDRENPQNVLKFRLVCDYQEGEDTIASSLSVTVYVEDVNDHSPVFVGLPYHVTVEELTPVGLTVFRGIRATDQDKPNTPNSDVQYAITGGNERGRFALDSSHRAVLLLKRPLDYDSGDREFNLTITASDRGLPPRSSNATVKVSVLDNDDLSPKFTKGVYRTRVTEFHPLTGARIHQRLNFDSPIYAFDQDLAIDAQIRYDIIAGNERHLFSIDRLNGTIYLDREIDLDQEKALPGNTFVLQIQASQVDNPLKQGVARVEVEVLDLNDNMPEFEVDFYNISIVENLPNGFSVLQVVATDQDQGDNGEFTYQLEDKAGAFSLEPKSGWLTVKDQGKLDRERRSSLSMRVFAREKVQSSLTNRKGTSSSVTIEVTLLDANDNNPSFVPSNLYEFLVAYDAKVGQNIGTVHAIDPDLGRNGLVLYSIQKTSNASSSVPFRIEQKTGRLMVGESPLLEGRHALFVEASDQPINPSERRFSLAVVTIEVTKHGPKGASSLPDFVGAPYEFWVGGNVDIGTSVGQVRVTENLARKLAVYDLLHSYDEGVPFAIEERSGTITVVNDLSKFERSVYDFEAVVSDTKDLSLVTNVTIHVVNAKDEHGILMKGSGASPIEFRVRENYKGVIIGNLLHKSPTNKSLTFVIANQRDITDHIAISPNGSLYTIRPLDREERDNYRLTIIAEYAKGVVSGTGIFQVSIQVEDENDNAPAFEHASYEGKIRENSATGTQVDIDRLIRATDADTGSNAHFTLSLQGEGSELFRLDKHSGKVYYSSSDTALDREEQAVYNLKVVAKDKGGLHSEAALTINIQDENDNAPIFVQMVVQPDKGASVLEYDNKHAGSDRPFGGKDKGHNVTSGIYALTQPNKVRGYFSKRLSPLISLPENIGVGSVVVRLLATDHDAEENAQIKYEMVSETFIPHVASKGDPFHIAHYFMIQPSTGEIVVARALPPEAEFRLNITATDNGGLKDNITIRILSKDVNDHAPIFVKSWYNFDTEESTYSRRSLGKLEATDGDFGQNSNISYRILANGTGTGDAIPFLVSEFTGNLYVNGELDRETLDKYKFQVVACDNPPREIRLCSTVNVEVNILDVNDNSPKFYGYDDLIPVPKRSYSESKLTNHRDDIRKIPVYYASAAENSPIGTPITRVFANDSDFMGNGNGLLLYDIPQRKSIENLFSVDTKDGVVTTIGKLDYETQKQHNITIVASDFGSPSLSATALLIVNVIDVPEDTRHVERPVFTHRYYEVEVEENVPVPLKLLQLNVTEPYLKYRLRYSLVTPEGSVVSKMFRIDPKNGTLYITETPDREKRERFEVRIKLDRVKIGRDMTVMVYPITNERLGNLGLNEVKVIVRITDVNDNVPKFTITGRPIVAAVPTSANYGFHVVKLQASDPDQGLNGEVRYQILGRADEATRRFAIDPLTGQVRCITSFSRDAGRVYGFDVKATDRRGADDGKSAIANVFVYVLDDQKQLVMVMGSKPTDVERNMENITSALYNATGFDVRIRKLEPHSERNLIDIAATDMYLYAVDPLLNVIVDMDELQKVLHTKQPEIERRLEGYRVLALASATAERTQTRNQRVLLSTLEVSVVVLGCVVFVGALATALCITCVRRKKRNQIEKNFTTHAQPLGYTLAGGGLGSTKGGTATALFPATFGGTGDNLHYAEPQDLFGTADLRRQRPLSDDNNSPTTSCHLRFSSRRTDDRHRSGKQGSRSRSHSIGGGGGGCNGGNGSGGVETSITSLHSSGKDSGIVDSGDTHNRCPCGHSTSHSSADSSNSSYEDSLKSVSHRKGNCASLRLKALANRNHAQRRSNKSTSGHHHGHHHQGGGGGGGVFHEELVSPSALHHLSHLTPTPALLLTSPQPPSNLRRSAERLVIPYPM